MATTPVLETSRLSTIFDSCREMGQDPEFTVAKRWLEEHPGKKAIGCFPIYCPVELIHAAGMLPLGIIGAGNSNRDHVRRFPLPVLCLLDRKEHAGAGTYGPAEISRRDVVPLHLRSGAQPGQRLPRNFPEMFVEYIHFPQNLASPLASNIWRRNIGGSWTVWSRGRDMRPPSMT